MKSDLVIFEYDTDSILNDPVSIIVYHIYKEWLDCSRDNLQRKDVMLKVTCKLFKDKTKCVFTM